MQGDRGTHDDNEFGIELQWPADTGDDKPPMPPPPSGRRSVAPAFEPPADEQYAAVVDVSESAVSYAPSTGGHGSDQPVPLLPAMAGRIESVHGAIATLGVRIDALAAASNSFRSVLSDRLSDHVDAMSRMANSHAQDLDDYRQANDQLIAELRQSAAENKGTLRQLVERFDDIAEDLAALTDAVAASQAAAGGPATGDVGPQLLDQVDDLVATNSGVVSEIQGLLARIETTATSAANAAAAAVPEPAADHTAELLDALAAIEDRLVAAEGQHATQLAELADGIAAIEERIADAAAVTGTTGGDAAAAAELVEALRRAAGEVEAAGDELRDVRVAVQKLQESGVSGVPLAASPLPPGDLDDLREELQAELGALREELTQLRRRISLRAKAPAVLEEDQVAAIVEAVAARINIPEGPPSVSLESDVLDDLADRVTERLAQSFEVVADEPEPAPPPPPPPTPSPPPRTGSGRLRAEKQAPASRPRRTR